MNKPSTPLLPTGVVELSAAEAEALQAQLMLDIEELTVLLGGPEKG